MNVLSSDGSSWKVQRQWMPRWEGRGIRARWRRRKSASDEVSGAADTTAQAADIFDNPFAIIGLAVAVILLIFGAIFFVVPLLLALFDLLLILAVAVLSILGRILLGRPWRIDAIGPDGTIHVFNVKGLRRSAAARNAIAASLRAAPYPSLDGKPADSVTELPTPTQA